MRDHSNGNVFARGGFYLFRCKSNSFSYERFARGLILKPRHKINPEMTNLSIHVIIVLTRRKQEEYSAVMVKTTPQ